MKKIYIKNEDKIIYGEDGENLLKILRSNNIQVNNNCGAKGKCGKCKVKIISGNYIEISKSDENHLSKKELDEGIRLSCMITLKEDMEIELINNDDNIHILADIDSEITDLNSNIRKVYVKIKPPSLLDQRDDLKRLKEALHIKDLKIKLKYLRNLSNILKENNYEITVTIHNNEIIHMEGKDTTSYNYGVAIDLGTTTIAAYLMDLNSGKIISLLSQVNNQRAYGSDVISRINYTMENEDGLEELNNSIINQINHMIDKLADKNNINKENIYNVVVVGNTTMIHLLTKTPCKNIALSPFIPSFTEKLEINSLDLDIKTNGIVTLPPSISAYVGSDITAGILSSKLYKNEKYSLLLDMGTNGEIALGNKDKIYTCSTAAGPAFEGANIKYGIGGVNGAISKIDLSKEHIFKTINDKEPCGICGSGVLDITSELLKYNIIDETGRLDDEYVKNKSLRERIENDNKIKEFVLYKDENKKISFTQKDIREVQLAKAAVCAGIKVLLKESNLTYEDIENVYLGGGFGNYMDVNSAVNIGMIPYELKDKIKSIGNCAGKGAINYLINEDKEKDMIDFVNKSQYIELSKSKDFQDFYIDSISFE